MKISEKLKMDYDGLVENGPITIVAFGDSVTHGCLVGGEMGYDTVYWNRLKNKLNDVRNYVPVNVINAGIGGITAKGSLGRMDSQVLCHNPDLVIVCFGLNDVNGELDDYINSLAEIFDRLNNAGTDVIFMTPNMLNTSVSDETEEMYKEYAKRTAEMQNNGRFDKYIASAIELANSKNVKVCDCYEKWKELSKTQDITNLLINKINHPTREMHELFAQSLFEIIMEG